jgi:hypothetical protein
MGSLHKEPAEWDLDIANLGSADPAKSGFFLRIGFLGGVSADSRVVSSLSAPDPSITAECSKTLRRAGVNGP